MSTRCRIGIKVGDRIKSIYCHHDGYPKGQWSVGQMLKDHYQDVGMIERLMDLGDISSLGQLPVADPHGWDFHLSSDCSMCVAYSTRGDTDVDSVVNESEDEYIEAFQYSDAEFLYLYKDEAWHILSRKSQEFIQF